VTDRETDRQTDTGRQKVPRLRVATRGKKTNNTFHNCEENNAKKIEA